MTKETADRALQVPSESGVNEDNVGSDDLGLAFSASSHELGFGVDSLPLLLNHLTLPAA
jgi:hypothetical protein